MVANAPLFSELTDSDIELIAGHGVVRSYPKNTILINEGDTSDNLYVIFDGRVKVYASDDDGREIVLNIQGPGEYFGELALIDDAPRSASIMTLESCRMAVVSKQNFHACLAEHPEFAVRLIRSLTQRVRALTDSVKSLALLDVYGRVARTLLDMAREDEGLQVIDQRLTHQDIANMVGASREMVSRIMKDLVTGGYLEVKDRHIVIHRRLPSRW